MNNDFIFVLIFYFIWYINFYFLFLQIWQTRIAVLTYLYLYIVLILKFIILHKGWKKIIKKNKRVQEGFIFLLIQQTTTFFT